MDNKVKVLSKEEILGQSFYPHECGSMIECATKQDALKAMQIFAEQEKRICAVGFERWKLEEGWLPEEKIEIFKDTVYGNMNNDDRLTLEQLYDKYLEYLQSLK